MSVPHLDIGDGLLDEPPLPTAVHHHHHHHHHPPPPASVASVIVVNIPNAPPNLSIANGIGAPPPSVPGIYLQPISISQFSQSFSQPAYPHQLLAPLAIPIPTPSLPPAPPAPAPAPIITHGHYAPVAHSAHPPHLQQIAVTAAAPQRLHHDHLDNGLLHMEMAAPPTSIHAPLASYASPHSPPGGPHASSSSSPTKKKGPKDRKAECEICHKLFLHNGHLTRHMRTHSGDRPFQCPNCERSFTSGSNLKRHQLVHTPQGYKPERVSCHICGRSLFDKSTLQRHIQTHSQGMVIKIQCPHSCAKTFKDMTSFERHVKIHSPACPYSCPSCAKIVEQHGYPPNVTDSQMSKYIMTPVLVPQDLHPPTIPNLAHPSAPGILRCPLCELQFQDMIALDAHRAAAHPGAHPPHAGDEGEGEGDDGEEGEMDDGHGDEGGEEDEGEDGVNGHGDQGLGLVHHSGANGAVVVVVGGGNAAGGAGSGGGGDDRHGGVLHDDADVEKKVLVGGFLHAGIISGVPPAASVGHAGIDGQGAHVGESNDGHGDKGPSSLHHLNGIEGLTVPVHIPTPQAPTMLVPPPGEEDPFPGLPEHHHAHDTGSVPAPQILTAVSLHDDTQLLHLHHHHHQQQQHHQQQHPHQHHQQQHPHQHPQLVIMGPPPPQTLPQLSMPTITVPLIAGVPPMSSLAPSAFSVSPASAFSAQHFSSS